MGLSDSGGEKADILLVREAETAEVVMDLRFDNDSVRFPLGLGIGMLMSIVIARRSIWRLKLESCCSVRPVEQTRSRM